MAPKTQKFEFEQEQEEDTEEFEPVFKVTDTFESRFGDVKAVVETPAPWETPDDMTPANEIVKSLDWEQHHYSFDGDRKAWTLDMSGLKPLGEAAQEAGYEWEGGARDESPDEADNPAHEAFVALTEAASEGDRLKVTYAKKNGNGLNTYKGEVSYAYLDEFDSTQNYVVWQDTDGKRKTLQLGEKGDPAIFSNGYHPFMGNLVEVTVVKA